MKPLCYLQSDSVPAFTDDWPVTSVLYNLFLFFSRLNSIVFFWIIIKAIFEISNFVFLLEVVWLHGTGLSSAELTGGFRFWSHLAGGT